MRTDFSHWGHTFAAHWHQTAAAQHHKDIVTDAPPASVGTRLSSSQRREEDGEYNLQLSQNDVLNKTTLKICKVVVSGTSHLKLYSLFNEMNAEGTAHSSMVTNVVPFGWCSHFVSGCSEEEQTASIKFFQRGDVRVIMRGAACGSSGRHNSAENKWTIQLRSRV